MAIHRSVSLSSLKKQLCQLTIKKDSRERECMSSKYILEEHGRDIMIIELARLAIILSTLIHFELIIFNHFGND